MVDLVAVVSYPNQTGGVILWVGDEDWTSARGHARDMFPIGSRFFIEGEKLKVGNYGHGKVYIPKRVMAKYGHLRKDGRYAFLLHPCKKMFYGKEVPCGKVIKFPGVEKLLESPQNRDILSVKAYKDTGILPETAEWTGRDWGRVPGIWFDENNKFYDDDASPVKTEKKESFEELRGPRITTTLVVSDEDGNAVVNPFLKGKGNYEGTPYIIRDFLLTTRPGNLVKIPAELMKECGYLREDGRYAFAITQGWSTFRGKPTASSRVYTQGLEFLLENAKNGEVIRDPYNTDIFEFILENAENGEEIIFPDGCEVDKRVIEAVVD